MSHPSNVALVHDPTDPTKCFQWDLSDMPSNTCRVMKPPTSNGTLSVGAGGGGTAVSTGRASVVFAGWQAEAVQVVTGQASVTANSIIWATIHADTDDVALENWRPPMVRSIVPGVGFTLVVRPEMGTHSGTVNVNWGYVA